MTKIIKYTALFFGSYIAANVTLFVLALLLIRDFPFFPKSIVVAQEPTITFEVSQQKAYHILLANQSWRPLSDSVDIESMNLNYRDENGTLYPVKLKKLDYFFEGRFNGKNFRGKAVASFRANKGAELVLDLSDVPVQYQAIIVRENLSKLIKSMAIFEFITIALSIIVFFILKRILNRNIHDAVKINK